MNEEEYLKAKIKDKKAIEAVKNMIEKKGIVSLDFEDVKSVVDKAKKIRVVSGTEKDFAKIPDMKDVERALLYLEGPMNLTLDAFGEAAEKITKMLNKNVHIIWGANISKRQKKIKITAVLGY
jgi:cell division GTPase FtsZ